MFCKSLAQTVANTEVFLYLNKKPTSNSCRFSAVELSKALTVYSVFSKIPFSWFNYSLRFTNKEAEFPRDYNWQKVALVRQEIRICPTSLCLPPNLPCSTLFQPPLGTAAPHQLLAGPTAQLAAGWGRLSWSLLAVLNLTGTALCLGRWSEGDVRSSGSPKLFAAAVPSPLLSVPSVRLRRSLRVLAWGQLG